MKSSAFDCKCNYFVLFANCSGCLVHGTFKNVTVIFSFAFCIFDANRHSISIPDQAMLPDLLYLARKSQKPKMSTKIRGNLITAVGWCQSNESESITGPILMGSTRGLIFETDLDSGEERLFTTSLEQYWKQIFDLGRGQHVPVTNLEYHPVPKSKKYFIMATTPNRLYQFVGNAGDPADRPLLQQVVNQLKMFAIH